MTSPLPDLRTKKPWRVVFVTGSTVRDRRLMATALAAGLPGGPYVVDGFELELRERCHAAHKLYTGDRLPAPAHAFDTQLDEAMAYFSGKTPRSAYAAFKRFIEQQMGTAAAGRWVVERCAYYRELQTKKGVPEANQVRGVIICDEAHTDAFRHVEQEMRKWDSQDRQAVQLCIVRDGTVSLPAQIEAVPFIVKNPGDDEESFLRAARTVAPHLFLEVVSEV